MSGKTEAERKGDVERLIEIQSEIDDLVGEARDIVRDYGTIADRAESYWVPHILGALFNETEWVGGSMTTMEDTINELDVVDEIEEIDKVVLERIKRHTQKKENETEVNK